MKLKGGDEYQSRIKKLEAELASKEIQWKETLDGKEDEIRQLQMANHQLNQDLSSARGELEQIANQHKIQIQGLELDHKKAL